MKRILFLPGEMEMPTFSTNKLIITCLHSYMRMNEQTDVAKQIGAVSKL
jgi:hypothetical protein